MAFCRFGADGSDVYCFYSTNDKYEVWCNDEWTLDTAQEAIDLLLKLREEGFNVPEYAIEGLKEDL
jgi:hypothetical protein